MKRIMFNDKYCLTDAVISGCKTMTRRACNIAIAGIDVPIDNMFVEDGIWKFTFRGKTYSLAKKYYPRYEVGDIVAVLQNYASLPNLSEKLTDELVESAGLTNKMFVKAEHMPYRIEITITPDGSNFKVISIAYYDYKVEIPVRLGTIVEATVSINGGQILYSNMRKINPMEQVENN